MGDAAMWRSQRREGRGLILYTLVVYRVTPEDVFFHEPLVVGSDVRHSRGEKRYYALGQTSAERRLFIAFTVRRSRIRVISVRDMNRKETATYAKYQKENS